MNNWLVVDDHPAICFALKALLSSVKDPSVTNSTITAPSEKNLFATDREILTTNNGVNALALIKEHNPQLVILDIMLNKMDGLQILNYIRQYCPETRVVIYSGLSPDIYAERAMRAGASAFFSKDDDISRLPFICQLVLQGYSCFPESVMSLLLSQSAGVNNREEALSRLSDRELTVLRYLSSGLSNKEIADRLILSNKTISTYKTRLMEKLQVNNTAELYAFLHNEENGEAADE